MDHTTARSTWEVIAMAMDEIYQRNASQLSFEELYRYAYNLVLHKHGALLYEGVAAKINQHLLQQVQELAEQPAATLLEDMADTWKVSEGEIIMSFSGRGGWNYVQNASCAICVMLCDTIECLGSHPATHFSQLGSCACVPIVVVVHT